MTLAGQDQLFIRSPSGCRWAAGAWPSCRKAYLHPPAHRPREQPRAPTGPGTKKGVHTSPRPSQALQHRSQSASDPAPAAHLVAQPPTRSHPGLLRCATDHGQGVWRPTLHTGQTLGTAAESEDPGAVLPVLALRGQPGPCPLGLLSRQGGEVCLSLPAAGASVYPRQVVRIGLDRDPAQAVEARMTRRTMRQLRLHWTSMPKGSPDDNPAETIFSDIQQNILDNSDDPDERTTKGRISNHLRARNRRPDRFIHIRYLEDTHKVHAQSLPMSCVQSAVVEPAENILNRHTVQGLTDCLVQAGPPHQNRWTGTNG